MGRLPRPAPGRRGPGDGRAGPGRAAHQVHVGFGLVAQLALSRRPEALLPVEYRHDESDAKVFTSGRIRVHSGQDVVGFPFTYRFP
ncbi:MAG TPA: hypothetical protein VFD84_02380 [Candidatus Binatia bacterium]|nr:hypothetical protein [Candidatus Binatia bacterium]